MYFGYEKSQLIGNELKANRVIPKTLTLPNQYQLSELGPVQDQGNRPICVSVSLSDIVSWHFRYTKSKLNFSNSIFYDLDPTASERGMTPLTAFKILTNQIDPRVPKGFETFALVEDAETMKRAILQYGPVMVALPVKSTMEDFWIGNQSLGGHAVTFVGWDFSGFKLRNSWGLTYGQGGYTTFPYSNFDLIFESWTLIK